jgi:hypothetical protein
MIRGARPDVQPSMLALLEQLKIVGLVVRGIMVPVVDLVALGNWAPVDLLPDGKVEQPAGAVSVIAIARVPSPADAQPLDPRRGAVS